MVFGLGNRRHSPRLHVSNNDPTNESYATCLATQKRKHRRFVDDMDVFSHLGGHSSMVVILKPGRKWSFLRAVFLPNGAPLGAY